MKLLDYSNGQAFILAGGTLKESLGSDVLTTQFIPNGEVLSFPWYLNNLQHWLGDFARLLKVQFKSNEGMSTDAPIQKCESEIDHYTGHYVPYSLRRVCGFFNVPQIYYMCKGL